MHRSRLCHFVIDVPDLDQGVSFWSAALNAAEEFVSENSRHIYRRLRIADSEVRILLQKTDDEKTAKERMHLDLETDDVKGLFEVNRDCVVVWLPGVSSWRWHCVSVAVCPGCGRCPEKLAGSPPPRGGAGADLITAPAILTPAAAR